MNYIEDMNSEEKLVSQSFAGKYALPINIERLEKNYDEYTENVADMREHLENLGADTEMGGDALDMYMDNISQSIHLYKMFKAIRKKYADIGVEINGNDLVLAKLFNSMYGSRPYMSYICTSIIRDVQEAFRCDVDIVKLSEYSDVIDELCTYIDNRVTGALNEKLSEEAVNRIDTIDFISKALYHGVSVHANAAGEVLYLKTEVVRDNQSSMAAAEEWESACVQFNPIVSFTRGTLFTVLVERIIELIQNGTLTVSNDELFRYAEVSNASIDAGETNLLQYLNSIYVNPQDKLMGMNKIVSTLAGDIFLLGNSKED